MDNGWAVSLIDIPLAEFNMSIRQVSKHQTLPGRGLERHASESAKSGEPVTLRSDKRIEDRRI
jgi:hypothetical protein